MTEYGRGQGSEPWHPETPDERQYGDQGGQGWGGQQAGNGSVPYDQNQPQSQAPYDRSGYGGGQQYPQQHGHPQHGHPQQGHPQQGHPQHQGHEQQAPQQQGHAQQQYYDSGQHPQVPQHGQYPQVDDSGQYAPNHVGGQYAQAHDSGQYAQAQQTQHAQQAQQQQHPQQHQYPDQQQYGGPGNQVGNQGGWDTGQQNQAVPYGMNPADPYSGQQPGYGGEQQDYYGTPEAYPPPQPPAQRRTPPEPVTDWDPDAPVEEEHPFFTGTDDGRTPPRGEEDEEYDDDPRSARRGKGGRTGKGKKKSRNGCACLVVSAVLLGGLGGVAYFGYDFWKVRFGPAEDFAGAGTDEQVQVEVKQGADGNEIATALKKAGVVKSIGAFTAEMGRNKKGNSLQVGFYNLKKEMSAKAALEMMLSPASRDALIVPEGRRNVWVYEQIDGRLGLAKGSTQKAAKEKAAGLGLPKWATGHPKLKDPLEGFLYPASYPVAKGSKPEEVLKRMVSRANQEYEKKDLVGEAAKLDLKSPFELLTVASLVQAEGKTHDDFRQMSEVIYNRLKKDNEESYGKIQFDSTYNYARGQSKINITLAEIYKDPNPYNTYYHVGLPPGPIGNPGDEALSAALSPSSDGWYYFVATDGMNKTEFARTHSEFEKLRDKFNASQRGR